MAIDIKSFRQNSGEAISGFIRHKGFKLSASLSFFTILTIGPMMLVMIFITSLFWGSDAVNGAIISQISDFVGNAAASRIQELIKNASVNSTSFKAVIGIAILVFAATTIFTDMQDSMNIIWDLKPRSGKTFQQKIKNRFFSFLIVAGLGLLMLLFLIANSLLEGFRSQLSEMFPQIQVTIVYVVNQVITFFIVTFLFAFVFRVLPDAVLSWKDVRTGALFSAMLFMAGRFGLSIYLKNSNIGSAYGSASSLIILLVWIFYSAIILYLGAEYTKAYYLRNNPEIKPKDFIELKGSGK
jgi:membrane protein